MKKILLLMLLAFCSHVRAQTLTIGQVFDFMPGDVFQYNYTTIYDMGYPSCWLPSITTKYTDSIASRYYSAASDTVFYIVSWTAYTPNGCTPTSPPQYSSGISTRYYTNLSSAAIDTAILTCQPVVDSFYVDYCGRNTWYYSNENDVSCFEAPIWSYKAIEGCGMYYSYRGGYGGEPHYSCNLTYYRKGSTVCGSYSTSGIEEKAWAELAVYPNPGEGVFEVDYSLSGSAGRLMIFDLSGKMIKEYNLEEGLNNTLRADLRSLYNGIYFYRLLAGDEVKASDKIVIIRQ
jgi:hypothetical protein